MKTWFSEPADILREEQPQYLIDYDHEEEHE